MGVKIGIVGCGSFSRSFINLFKAHPSVDSMVLCDLDQKKIKERSEATGIDQSSPSLDELLKTDVDAVAIFTQNWLHGPQAKQALLAGKHVYSAVPMGISVEEIKDIVDAVEKTGNVYMMGETSYYYPEVIYCREQQKKNRFGKIVLAECEYYHDWDHGLYDVMRWRGGEDWKKLSGSPPMYYPTHSIACFVSVTGAHLTKVSCQGFVDPNEDGYDLYGEGKNIWDNPFSNETALFSASDGSCVRINEYRRIGHTGTVRMSLFGTQASFENRSTGITPDCVIRTKHADQTEVLNDQLECKPRALDEQESITDQTLVNFAKVHPVHELPTPLQKINSGHFMSHNFLINDFVNACVTGRQPHNHAWDSARYTVPGIIAHESAKKGGELLPVPDFGNPTQRG